MISASLNSDALVKRLTIEDRPAQNERARAEVLAALEADFSTTSLVDRARGGKQ